MDFQLPNPPSISGGLSPVDAIELQSSGVFWNASVQPMQNNAPITDNKGVTWNAASIYSPTQDNSTVIGSIPKQGARNGAASNNTSVGWLFSEPLSQTYGLSVSDGLGRHGFTVSILFAVQNYDQINANGMFVGLSDIPSTLQTNFNSTDPASLNRNMIGLVKRDTSTAWNFLNRVSGGSPVLTNIGLSIANNDLLRLDITSLPLTSIVTVSVTRIVDFSTSTLVYGNDFSKTADFPLSSVRLFPIYAGRVGATASGNLPNLLFSAVNTFKYIGSSLA